MPQPNLGLHPLSSTLRERIDADTDRRNAAMVSTGEAGVWTDWYSPDAMIQTSEGFISREELVANMAGMHFTGYSDLNTTIRKLSAGPDAGFPDIANGLPGLETRLPLMFDAMISQGRGGPEMFARLTATAAAEIYGLPNKGRLAAGMDADITIWNPEKSITYGANDLHDNVGYNPWEGRTITGWPTDVWLRGAHIVQDCVFHGTPGAGAKIDRPTLAVAPTEPQTNNSQPMTRGRA